MCKNIGNVILPDEIEVHKWIISGATLFESTTAPGNFRFVYPLSNNDRIGGGFSAATLNAAICKAETMMREWHDGAWVSNDPASFIRQHYAELQSKGDGMVATAMSINNLRDRANLLTQACACYNEAAGVGFAMSRLGSTTNTKGGEGL